MKFWSIFVLTFFLNFTIMPSIIAILGVDTQENIIVLAEEEVHTNSVEITEKALPKSLNINDFIEILDKKRLKTEFIYKEDRLISPHISIISPPPEC